MLGLMIAGAVAGIVLLAACYLVLLAARYPEEVRTNEVCYIQTADLWRIRLCRFRKEGAAGPPVLLVHGMGANQNNFTCPAERCLVDFLRDNGLDCWTVDLRGSRSSLPAFERSRNGVRMEDFLTQDLPAVVRFILEATGHDQLHWVGHSMGGMLLYAYGEMFGCERIASGVTLGSPIDFNDVDDALPPGVLFIARLFPALSGNVVRGLIPLMKALRLGVSAFPINMDNLPESLHAGHFINMLEDPLPALMRQVNLWMRHKEYRLNDGALDVAAELPKLTMPLLAFFAARDPFVEPRRAQEILSGVGSRERRFVLCSKDNGFVEDYSHVDLAFSREAETEIYQPILDWILRHAPSNTTVEAAPFLGAVEETAPALPQAAPPKARTARKPAARKVAAAAESETAVSPAKASPAKAGRARASAAKPKAAAAKPRAVKKSAEAGEKASAAGAPPAEAQPAPSAKRRTRKAPEPPAETTET